MRVIVTRPLADARQWVYDFQAAGQDAVALPLMEITGPPVPQAVEEAWAGLAVFNAVMFVSGNAVLHFFKQKPPQCAVFSAQEAIKIRAYAPGPGTAEALLHAGVAREWIDVPAPDAAQFDSEALWEIVQSQVMPGFRLLVVRGATAQAQGQRSGVGRDWFAQQVQAAGGTVDFVVAYQRALPAWTPDELALAHSALADGALWLLTSSEAVTHLSILCTGHSFQHARAVATHPRIARAARSAGFGMVVESAPSFTALLSSIESLQ
jgi:uroporphyrinogen-III synthase